MDDGEEIAHYVNKSLGYRATDLCTRMEDELCDDPHEEVEDELVDSDRDYERSSILKYLESLCSRIADFFDYREEPLSEKEKFYRFVDNDLDMSEFKDYTD